MMYLTQSRLYTITQIHPRTSRVIKLYPVTIMRILRIRMNDCGVILNQLVGWLRVLEIKIHHLDLSVHVRTIIDDHIVHRYACMSSPYTTRIRGDALQ